MTGFPVTRESLMRYGFIAVPLAFAGFPLYVLAPDFYATTHGVPLAVLGMILLGIRLWDAVQDPFIGWLTDRWAGRLMPFVVVAMVFLCTAIILLFNAVLFSPAIWFGLCMFVAVTAYSMVTIILGAQATLWTEDKDDQTRIAAAREGWGLFGIILAVSTPTILQKTVSDDHVYIWYGVILCVLACAGLAFFARTMTGARSSLKSLKAPSPFSALRGLSRSAKRLFMVYAVSMLASSIPAVLVIFFVRDLLGAGDMVGAFLLLYFMSGVIGMPLWKKISTIAGKYGAWAISNILAVSGFIGAFFLGQGDIIAYAFVCLMSGLALGADLTLPPSALSSQIHASGKQHLSATYYAFLAFIAKASLALASAIALPYLDYAGFVPQSENGADALLALSVAYALIPCILKLLAAALLYYFFIRPSSGGNDEIVQNHSNHRSPYHA